MVCRSRLEMDLITASCIKVLRSQIFPLGCAKDQVNGVVSEYMLFLQCYHFQRTHPGLVSQSLCVSLPATGLCCMIAKDSPPPSLIAELQTKNPASGLCDWPGGLEVTHRPFKW